MKGLKRFVFLLALVTLPVVIESCFGCNSGYECCGDYPTNFNITSLSVRTINRKGAALDAPSPGPLKNFGFAVTMEADYRMASAKHSRPTMAAFACDPAVPVGDQKITSISVKSNNPLTTTNGSFAAGDELGSIFLVMYYGYTYKIEDLINKDLYPDSFIFISDSTVDAVQRHKLTIKITFDDGQTFDLVTDEAELTPA